MPRVFNFSRKEVQVLPDDAQKGWVLKLASDPSLAAENGIINGVWGAVALSELAIDSITDDQRDAIVNALGISAGIKLPTADLTNLFQDQGDNTVTVEIQFAAS